MASVGLRAMIARARSKATTEVSFASHYVGHLIARATTRASDARSDELADRLRASGYAIIPPDERMAAFVRDVYLREMKPAWDNAIGTWRDPPTGGTYKLFLSEICERWPSVLEVLDGRTAAFLRAYYRTRFQYSYVEPYRTFPAVGALPKSWKWHHDAVAPGILKLMIYLNGATAETGALRVLDHAHSRELRLAGFRNRVDSQSYADEFERRQTVLEGLPGTAVVIDNRVLHKATAPATGFRDVLCFQILPSIVEERDARKRGSRSYASSTPQYPFLPRLW
jgi:hypothetical protein